MKKLLLIGLTFLVLNALAAQKSIDLPNIKIQENRLEVPFSESARSLEIITKNEIKYLPVDNINELLQYIGGVDIRRRGPNGVQADLSFRGSTFEQVLVLINGVKVIDPQTGHHVMNLPIDLDIIERIEIVKGPASTLYGSEAVGGLINIITKKPINAPLVSADVFGTSWGEVNTDIGLRYNLSKKTEGLMGINSPKKISG